MKIRKQLAAILAAFLFLAGTLTVYVPPAHAQQQFQHKISGEYYPPAYAFWRGNVEIGNSSTGSQTITVSPMFVSLPDGYQFSPWSVLVPITIDIASSTNSETVFPTAVSCSPTSGSQMGGTCSITASFSFTHGTAKGSIQTGTYGTADAQLDAFNGGGGEVLIDNSWGGGTSSLATVNSQSIVPLQTVGFHDKRGGTDTWWIPQQSLATVLAAPTTLTSSTVGDALTGTAALTTGGHYTNANPYYTCIAYVDVMGNEGPCSATYNFTPAAGSTNQIGYTAPAASTGAVGYTIYISLTNGSYNLTYQVPLTSSVCTLTKLENVTPACAVANTTYAQTGSQAVVSALTVNTAPLHLLKTTASTTSAYIGTPSGRTAYVYAPAGQPGLVGMTLNQQAYTISTAASSAVPYVIATIPVPIGQMNNVGRQLCVEGSSNIAANGTTATIQNIEFLWDAAGSNTAGAPVIIGQLQMTVTGAGSLAEYYTFHECFETTVSGSSVTAGSVTGVGGIVSYGEGAGTLHAAGSDVLSAAAVASLNLAGTGGNTQRLHVVWLHTTGTDANGMTVTGLRSWFQ